MDVGGPRRLSARRLANTGFRFRFGFGGGVGAAHTNAVGVFAAAAGTKTVFVVGPDTAAGAFDAGAVLVEVCGRHVAGARDANQSSMVERGQPTLFAPIRCGSGKLPSFRQRQIVTELTPSNPVTSFMRRNSGACCGGFADTISTFLSVGS